MKMLEKWMRKEGNSSWGMVVEALEKMKMLEKWMRKEGNSSWAMVVEALENMSELRLANQLRVTYCTQQHQDGKPLTNKGEEEADSQITKMEKVLMVDQLHCKNEFAKITKFVADTHC